MKKIEWFGMIIPETYLRIKFTKNGITQTIEFPEEYTNANRLRWWTVKILAGVKMEWFQ